MKLRAVMPFGLAVWLCLAAALPLGRTAAAQAAAPGQAAAPLILTVREVAGVNRAGEVVRSGVPLPRSLNVLSTTGLAVADAGGRAVPAEFKALARWNAGREVMAAPIQWLLVTFPVTVTAHSSATFRLVTDGSTGPNPAPARPLRLTQAGDRVTVDAGAATFVIGGWADALFDEIRGADGALLASGGALTATVNGANTAHTTMRRVVVEHAGPLSAVVVIAGAYDLPPVGGGGLGSARRYLFTAGSPTAIVRHSVAWEGDLCPASGWDLTCAAGEGTIINGLRMARLRDTLTLNMAPPIAVTAIGSAAAPAVTGNAAAGETAWVRQALRSQRSASLAFDAQVPGAATAVGEKADGGLLAASGMVSATIGAGMTPEANAGGALAIALDHMHRYEPQALRLLADGRLAFDLADDQVWLGQRQGLFATLAVSALPPAPSRADLDRLTWAPLNHPLRAWPGPEWFAASGAVDEIASGALPANVADYDILASRVLSDTLRQTDAKGLAGLMTFGLYPRYWGMPVYGDELDCGDADPTPGELWDNAYWCGTWTDYHNTAALAPVWAMRSGETAWLDEIATPAALRMLHTQIQQCAPDDPWFHCGAAPAGYGGYRTDFNGSHAYFDNLFLYYWLTGDTSVVETLQRGASAMRNYLCSRRPAQPCLPNDPPTDEWAAPVGRVASQWFAVFRFVGLASADASYLEDWRSGLARAVTQYYVEAEQGGTRYGFWLDPHATLTGPGTYSTDQLWMASLYDMNNLYRLLRDTDDAALGDPAAPPSQVLVAWARTLTRFGSTASGDGTAAGAWPNALNFTWTGARIGGTLTGVTANTSGGDPYLWNTGKATLTATLLRAAALAPHGASDLRTMGADLTRLALDAIASEQPVLGKIAGLYLARVPAAVALIAGPPAGRWLIYLPVVWRAAQ